MPKFIDLVISGCDFSGTTSQINGISQHLITRGKIVRDISGNDFDAMFHADSFLRYNADFSSLREFMKDTTVSQRTKDNLKKKMFDVWWGMDRTASMVHNAITEYIDPASADVWVMNEPTNRGAGQMVRKFELQRSMYGLEQNNIAASLGGQAYRSSEFHEFRKLIREAGKQGHRSRSEESCVYQIEDENGIVRNGISAEDYLSLPGHAVAFANPPTHIFLVVGPADWTKQDYTHLRNERKNDGRILDDNEKFVGYQTFINQRYATDWIDNIYRKADEIYHGGVPEITRFDIYDSKEEVLQKMIGKLEKIMNENAA